MSEKQATPNGRWKRKGIAANDRWRPKQPATPRNCQECRAKDPASCEHPNCPDGALAAYANAVDEDVLDFIDEARSKGQESVAPIAVAEISAAQAETLKNLNGADYTGYSVCLTGGAIAHIDKRHGIKGKADRSMADDRDLARIGWVINNFDSVEVSQKKNKRLTNTGGTASDIFVFTKRINGQYFVAMAAPVTGKRAMYVLSAYKSGQQKTGH